MELLEKKIKKFLSLEIGSDYGSGYGYGGGYGDGSGFGWGDGCGNSSGYGSDYGSGYGCGDGSGFGWGNGCGDGIKSINGLKVYKIDGVQTIITNVIRNVAKGFILSKDLTLKKCFVVKGQNMFAHGETLEKAREDLQDKIFNGLDVEERIAEFKKTFKANKKYRGTEFYKWHNLLTGSCEMGRNEFVKSHGIDLEDEFTVKEFVELCKNDFGGQIIRMLED